MAFIRVRINVSFRSSYVTSILITKLAFAMFLLKLNTLSAAIYFSLYFISFVAFMPEVNRSFSLFFFQYSISDVDIRH